MRSRICLVAAVVSLTIAEFVGPILAWLLLIAAFGFVLDAATAWWAAAGGTGGMRDYKQ